VAKTQVDSAARALVLLNLFMDRDEVRVTDASAALSISVSSAHRLLATFESLGYVRQQQRHAAYTAGPALANLATAVGRRLNVADAARPRLLELVRELNETAHVAILRGSEVVFLDCVMPQRRTPASSRKGRSLPAHATAAGKVLLADLSRAEIERLYPADDLPRLTSKTLTTRSTLFNDLRRVRERGYATHIEESERQMVAYACPMRDESGIARAALVVAGPVARFKTYAPASIVAALKAAAAAAYTARS
jgi:IclR family transcriptional regulator, acetate operon repressor